MKGWRCIACRAANDPDDVACENCGVARPTPKTSAIATPRCPVDGEPLDARGFCAFGGGFPASARCALACPICRGLLTWDGRCFRCFGTPTGQREDWTIPGDRYEIQRGHWRLVETGPCSVLSREINRAATSLLGVLMDRKMTEAETLQAIQDIMRLAEMMA